MKISSGFRPLIRGFFFYYMRRVDSEMRTSVSVPLFGDSFFMRLRMSLFTTLGSLVSVPLFGDSFFI